MELVDVLRLLRRRWVAVLAGPLLGVTIAFLTAPSAADVDAAGGPAQTATHTLLQDAAEDDTSAPPSVGRVELQATTGEVPRRVVDRLGLDEPPAVVASEVAVQSDADVGYVTLTARGADGDRAARLANAFAEELLAVLAEQTQRAHDAEVERLGALVEGQLQQVAALEERLAGEAPGSAAWAVLATQRDAAAGEYQETYGRHQVLITNGPPGAGYSTMEAASPVPEEAEGFQAPDDRATRMVIGLALGLVLGVGLAHVLDRVDTRIRGRDSAERAFGVPVVAEIPLDPWWRRRRVAVTALHPASGAAEGYRALRLALSLMPRWILPADGPLRPGAPAPGTSAPGSSAPGARSVPGAHQVEGPAQVVLVSSAAPGDGKTTTVANLAASYAEGGKEVLLLDCDLRGGQLHDFFGVPNDVGVRDLLAGEAATERLPVLAQDTLVDRVRLVPRGDAWLPTELMGQGTRLLDAARHLADVVLVDTGPLLSVADSAALVPAVDAVVVVARSGRTTATEAARIRHLLAQVSAPVVGVALVGVDQIAASSGSSGVFAGRRVPRPEVSPVQDPLDPRTVGTGGPDGR